MLFEPYKIRHMTLQNRIVMAPMTRCRATPEHVPTPLMAEYYAQRAEIGLIITEGTSPSPDGLGYARIPGLFNAEHVAAWKPVTEAVHARGGHIVVQLMHTGRISAEANLPPGARVVGPVAERAPGQMYTDGKGMQPHADPHELSEAEIRGVVKEYVQSARLAVEAGFDAVELHGANGYLLEQFLNGNINRRDDGYGGSPGARNRLMIEVAEATAVAIGRERVGVRLSPYGTFNGTGIFESLEAQYVGLVTELGAMALLYLHLVDHSSQGTPPVPIIFRKMLRRAFPGAFIASGGLDRARAETLLAADQADLFAFGRPALANPDLVTRLRTNAPLNAPDSATFYTPGPKGYTDYPTLGG